MFLTVSLIYRILIVSLSNLKPLSANPTKWSDTLKQFVGNLLTNCLSVFDHFVGLALKGLRLLYLKIAVNGSDCFTIIDNND